MDWKRIALGIGNPGAEYDGTRHNVGFMVLDRVAARLGLQFERLQRRTPEGERLFSGKVKSQVAYGRTGAESSVPFVLLKPLTFVNLSGDVAGAFMRTRELPPESLFVVVDDLNLPLGRIRCRPAGSAGGHNGLRSIEQALGSQDYPRLRLGIGAPMSTMVDHVLDPFSQEEWQVLGPTLDRAADVVCEWLGGVDLQSLMESCNRRDPEPADQQAEAEGTDDPSGTELET